jgi:hypothetical protein
MDKYKCNGQTISQRKKLDDEGITVGRLEPVHKIGKGSVAQYIRM